MTAADPKPSDAPTKDDAAFAMQLSLSQRLSTRLVFMQGLVLAAVLVLASYWIRSRELTTSRERLHGDAKVMAPFMVESVRPALDLAWDDAKSGIDEELFQAHVVDAVFATARSNPDLVFIELAFSGGGGRDWRA